METRKLDEILAKDEKSLMEKKIDELIKGYPGNGHHSLFDATNLVLQYWWKYGDTPLRKELSTMLLENGQSNNFYYFAALNLLTEDEAKVEFGRKIAHYLTVGNQDEVEALMHPMKCRGYKEVVF